MRFDHRPNSGTSGDLEPLLVMWVSACLISSERAFRYNLNQIDLKTLTWELPLPKEVPWVILLMRWSSHDEVPLCNGAPWLGP